MNKFLICYLIIGWVNCCNTVWGSWNDIKYTRRKKGVLYLIYMIIVVFLVVGLLWPYTWYKLFVNRINKSRSL